MMICAKCQKETDDDIHYSKSIREGQCFSCTFWWELTRSPEPGTKQIVVDGHVYQFRPGKWQGPTWSLGFGGREFYIKKHHEGLMMTNSMWHRGKVPPEWREKFPDDAVFINGEQWQDCGGTMAFGAAFTEAAHEAQR